VPLGLDLIDAALADGGLACGAVHEWLGVDEPFEPFEPFEPVESANAGSAPSPLPASSDARNSRPSSQPLSQPWSPPLTMLLHIARRACAVDITGNRQPGPPGLPCVWVGRAVWPYPRAMDPHALGASLFIDTASPAERVWAADVALRGGAAAVIVDGRGFDMAATRRLQLAAEAGRRAADSRAHAGCSAVCVLARPARDRTVLSAATTRWRIGWQPPDPLKALNPLDALGARGVLDGPDAQRRINAGMSTTSFTRRWTVELLRCKGVQPGDAHRADRAWCVEQDDATRALCVVAHLPNRSSQAQAAAPAAAFACRITA